MQGNHPNKHKHVRPSIQQHADLLIDKRYHHKAEVTKKFLIRSQLERDVQQQIKEYLDEHD